MAKAYPPEELIKKSFVITMLGVAAFGAVVLLFVL
jgi:hypothetical protein